jgi:hypothetical protein
MRPRQGACTHISGSQPHPPLPRPLGAGKTHAGPPGKHFLHIDDFSKEELLDMLERGEYAQKKLYARDESFKPFAGKTMAMIFTKPSARTRVTFETVRAGARRPGV